MLQTILSRLHIRLLLLSLVAVAPAFGIVVYTSVEQLKSRVGITDTADDFECQLAVQAAAAEIQRITGRFFWNQTGTRRDARKPARPIFVERIVGETAHAQEQVAGDDGSDHRAVDFGPAVPIGDAWRRQADAIGIAQT